MPRLRLHIAETAASHCRVGRDRCQAIDLRPPPSRQRLHASVARRRVAGGSVPAPQAKRGHHAKLAPEVFERGSRPPLTVARETLVEAACATSLFLDPHRRVARRLVVGGAHAMTLCKTGFLLLAVGHHPTATAAFQDVVKWDVPTFRLTNLLLAVGHHPTAGVVCYCGVIRLWNRVNSRGDQGRFTHRGAALPLHVVRRVAAVHRRDCGLGWGTWARIRGSGTTETATATLSVKYTAMHSNN